MRNAPVPPAARGRRALSSGVVPSPSSPRRRAVARAVVARSLPLAAVVACARRPAPAPRPTPAPLRAAVGTAPGPAAVTAAGSLRLDLNWGVDTAAIARAYVGGNRPSPVGAVVAAWRAYLDDRPDSLHASAYWSAAEQRRLAPGAEYDFTRAFVFQGRNWARGVRLTVLDVHPAAPDSAAWELRTLFARVGADSAVRVLAIVRTRVVREDGRWVLASPLAAATAGWARERVGRIAYVHAPGRPFDRARATRAARFVDSLAVAFAVAPPDSIQYLVAGSPEEAQRVVGLEWALPTPGIAHAASAFLYSGDPTLGEFYAHELAHVVLAPAIGAGVPGMAQEGLATWVGGSLGRDFPTLMREYGAFLRGRPEVTLSGIVRGAYDYDAGWRPAAALLFALVHEHGGMPAVLALLAELARPAAVLFLNPDERFAEASARALGVPRPTLDDVVRARALRYAVPTAAAPRGAPVGGW